MTQNIIDFSAIEKTPVQKSPYPFFGIDNVFDIKKHQDLLQDFPSITSGGSFPLENIEIKGAMAQLIKDIESDEFRRVMGQKFDVELKDKPLIITARGFSRQKDGQNHTDSKTKLITVLLYVNDGWESPVGRLRMLNGDDIEDVAAEFSSSIGQMIAFKVTDNCWHGYHPYEGIRQSLQINYLVEEKYTSHHVYRHKLSAFIKRLFKSPTKKKTG